MILPTVNAKAHRSRRYYFAVLVPLVVICFYLIDHTWEASSYFMTVGFDYDGTENVTADKLSGVNGGSSLGRLAIALFGVIGLILPSDSRLRFQRPLLWTMVAYFGWLYTTVLWSIEPSHTAYKLMVLGVFLLGAFGIARQLTIGQLTFAFGISCLSLVALGIAVELSLGNFSPFWQDYRFTGTVHPNTQSIYGAVICMTSVIWLGNRRKMSIQIAGVVVLLIGITVLLLTKSRTALVSTTLGLIAIQGIRARGGQRVALALLGVSGLAVAILVVSFSSAGARSKIGGLASMGRSDKAEMTTLTGRLPLWDELLSNYKERPIYGHGYLAFWDAERVEALGDVFEWEIPHGHNMYIDVLLDGGAIGLALFVLFFVTAWFSAARTFHETNQLGYAMLFGMITFAIVHGIGESFFKLLTLPNFVLTTLLMRLLWEPFTVVDQNMAGDAEHDESQLELAGAEL